MPALRDVDFLVACPFARGTMGYQGIAEQDVYDVLADVKRRYPVDDDRVYLTGASMGGGGALWLGADAPRRLGRGGARVPRSRFRARPNWRPMRSTCPCDSSTASRIPRSRVEVSRQWQRRLLTLGSPVEYIEFPGVRHNAWDFAYRNGAIFEWLAKFRRNRDPDHVRFVTRGSARYRSGVLGAAGRPDRRTRRLRSTRCAPRPACACRRKTWRPSRCRRPPRSLTVDGAPLRLKPGAPLAFARTPKGWTQAAPTGGRPRGTRTDRGGRQRPPHLCLRRGRSAGPQGRGDAPPRGPTAACAST